MRILHVTNSLTRLGTGIAAIVWGVAGPQRAAGHSVALLALADPFDGQDWPTGRDPAMLVQTYRRTGPFGMFWSRQLHAAMLDPSLGGSFDVLHQHGIWTMISRSAIHWRRRWRRPSVISPQGMLDETRLTNSRKWAKRLFGLAYENRNLRGTSCLHALCRAEADSIRGYGLRNPVCTIPNGVDLGLYRDLPPAHRFAERYPQAAERRLVLFLGRVTELKGVSPLLDAWRKLSRFRQQGWLLVLAGNPDGTFVDLMRSKANALGLERDVLFTGPLVGEPKREVLAAAEAFVLPSFSEGFSMSLLEAMACGLPVVATPFCNFDEIATAGTGWIVQPDPEDIARGLDACLSLPQDQRQAMGQRGRDLVAAKYTWDEVSRQLGTVYGWLLGGGTAPECVQT